jgi:hypothetical protein
MSSIAPGTYYGILFSAILHSGLPSILCESVRRLRHATEVRCLMTDCLNTGCNTGTQNIYTQSFFDSLAQNMKNIFMLLKPHCIRCSHFKVDDVSALEPSSKLPVRIVEDNVTALLHQQRTP